MDEEFGLVQLATKQLPLGEGKRHWIEVKTEISYGEELTLTNAAFGKVGADWEFGVDMRRFDIQRILTWVVDWSIKDKKDNKLPITMETVALLNRKTSVAINQVLDKYLTEMAELKKVTIGSNESEPKS